MTKPLATLQSGELLSTGYLREPVRMFLSARPEGIGEAMLVHLVRTDDMHCLGRIAPAYAVTSGDRWIDKVREACHQVGATRDERGVWRMPARKRMVA